MWVSGRPGKVDPDDREEADMVRIGLMAVAVATALALAACGEDAGGGGGGDGGTAGGTLSMIDNEFDPASLTVGAGDSVEVSNDGANPHNITIEGTDIDEDVDPGGSTSVTIDAEPGEYTMFCEFHRSGGMEGTVTVE
jgi:plastocyanin